MLNTNTLALEGFNGLSQIQHASKRCFLFYPSTAHLITPLQSLFLLLVGFLGFFTNALIPRLFFGRRHVLNLIHISKFLQQFSDFIHAFLLFTDFTLIFDGQFTMFVNLDQDIVSQSITSFSKWILFVRNVLCACHDIFAIGGLCSVVCKLSQGRDVFAHGNGER